MGHLLELEYADAQTERKRNFYKIKGIIHVLFNLGNLQVRCLHKATCPSTFTYPGIRKNFTNYSSNLCPTLVQESEMLLVHEADCSCGKGINDNLAREY